MMKRIAAILLAMLLLCAGVCGAAAEDALHLQNVVLQEDGTVDLVVAVPRTENLGPADFTIMADKEVIAAESVASIGRSDIVTRWVIVFDLSMSYKRFDAAKNMVTALIDQLPEKDQIAVMTTGMAATELQWTLPRADLKQQVAALKRNNSASALNAAAADAVAVLENQAAALDRTCVVLVSHGENSNETGMTQNELVATIARSHVAVYTYAFQDDAPAAGKLSSYGAYARAGAGGAEIVLGYYENDAAANAGKLLEHELCFRVVTVSNAALPQEVGSFTVSFTDGALSMADEYQLTTVQQKTYEDWQGAHRAAAATATPEPTAEPTSTPVPTAVPTPVPDQWDVAMGWVGDNLLYILGGVLAVLIVVLVMLKRKKPVEEEPTPDVQDEDGETQVDTDTMKLLVKLVRTDDGSIHAMTMSGSMIIGRRKPDADLVIPGDDKMSRVHARLSMVKGAMVLENLSGTNGTYVNGKKIDGQVRLHQQDVLKMGEKYYQISWSMQ